MGDQRTSSDRLRSRFPLAGDGIWQRLPRQGAGVLRTSLAQRVQGAGRKVGLADATGTRIPVTSPQPRMLPSPGCLG